MSVTDHIRGLFARAGKAPELSPSVVRHARIDEVVRDDLRTHSGQFDRALDRQPEVDGDPYSLAPDLWSDLFYSHYTSGDHVDVKGTDEVKPSHALHQRIMQQYVNHDDARATRALTRDDDMASALATMAAQQALERELGDAMEEQAARAEQMAQQEDRIEAAQQALSDLREQAQQEQADQGAASAETKAEMRQQAQAKADARSALMEQIQQQDAQGFGGNVSQAVDKAVDEAHEVADAWRSMPGTSKAAAGQMNPDEAFSLATQWKDNAQLQEVAKLLGRMEPDFRFRRSNRVQGGREEIVDVELGNDLSLILPTELMKLGHPVLKYAFFKGYVERSLLQYETVGERPAGDGPIITLRDISGSMKEARIIWASAVTLALLSIAKREHRLFANVDFNKEIQSTRVFPKGRYIDPLAVTNIAGTSVSGGTDITQALLKAEEIIELQSEFRTADVVLITDGADKFEEIDEETLNALARMGVRVHAFVIGRPETYYTEMCAAITGGMAVSVAELTAPSDATKNILTAIT